MIPEPEVKTFDLQDSDEFMIMASDGVWEFITSQVRESMFFLELFCFSKLDISCVLLF